MTGLIVEVEILLIVEVEILLAADGVSIGLALK